jgi:hypothetical protein
MGFIGGSPSSSFYFIASQMEEKSTSADSGTERVIYLDPHLVQPTVRPSILTFVFYCFCCCCMRAPSAHGVRVCRGVAREPAAL